ncbi:MAG: tyrosine-type recombinase/integrase [Candidatus Bathyarchaeia archaeon]
MKTQLSTIKREPLSDEALINEFIADCRLRNFSSESIRSYKSILRITCAFLRRNGYSFVNLDKHVLKRLLEYLAFDKGYSVKTLENYFSALSSFYDFLVYEGVVEKNHVLPFRKRYIRQYKTGRYVEDPPRKLISVEQMRMLIDSILDPRDKAIVTLLAKTGIRRKELINIDLDDINWEEQSIQLKPHPKRSNLTVFFDDECARVLLRWLNARKYYPVSPDCRALFVNERGERLNRHGVYDVITKYAEKVGLHNPNSKRMEDHFTPHCCRHWFTTWLLRNGMPREYVKELRGDKRSEAIDIYHHIDKKELRRAYLACIPRLGI